MGDVHRGRKARPARDATLGPASWDVINLKAWAEFQGHPPSIHRDSFSWKCEVTVAVAAESSYHARMFLGCWADDAPVPLLKSIRLRASPSGDELQVRDWESDDLWTSPRPGEFLARLFTKNGLDPMAAAMAAGAHSAFLQDLTTLTMQVATVEPVDSFATAWRADARKFLSLRA